MLDEFERKKAKAIKKQFKKDGFPVDMKFGEFEIFLEDDAYKIVQSFHIHTEPAHRKEMIDLSQILTKYYEDNPCNK